jgi:hypothetical protein
VAKKSHGASNVTLQRSLIAQDRSLDYVTSVSELRYVPHCCLSCSNLHLDPSGLQ